MHPSYWKFGDGLDVFVSFWLGIKTQDDWIEVVPHFFVCELMCHLLVIQIMILYHWFIPPCPKRKVTEVYVGWLWLSKGYALGHNLGGFTMCWWGECTSVGYHYSQPIISYSKSKLICDQRHSFGGSGVYQKGMHSCVIKTFLFYLHKIQHQAAANEMCA